MRRPLMAVCIGFVLVTALSMFNGWFARPGLKEFGAWNNREVVATGHVYRKDVKYFYLDSVFVQNQAANQQQSISLKDKYICEYEQEAPLIGSNITIRGVLCCFSEATNPGEFDSAGYYRSIGIGGKIKVTELLEQSGEFSWWREALFELQQYFRQRLYTIFPEKEASIMTAMLLGDKSKLDEETKELYQENGIIHILSISGLHITIIGMGIYRLLRRSGLPIWTAAMVAGVVLLFYGVMTGMSISACRAIGMFLLRMLAELTGRTYDMLTAVGVMAAGMLGWNPYCFENGGFLLSYSAILGIGVLYPALLWENGEREGKVRLYEDVRWKRFVKDMWGKLKDGLKQSMLSGASIALTTLPIQLWFYYEVPTYSILLNILVLPLMSVVMLCGLIAMLVPGLGALGTIDCIILRGYEWLCRVFEAFPFSKWNPGQPAIWQMILYYMGWVSVVLLGRVYNDSQEKRIKESEKKGREKSTKKDVEEGGSEIVRGRKRALTRFLLLTTMVITLSANFLPGTTITFLDVGQGDCICVQLTSGEVYLFDCGSSSRSRVGEYVLKPFLKYSGIRHIDAIFLSHPDEDHCNGVRELLANSENWGITVDRLVLPEVEGIMEEVADWEGMEKLYAPTPFLEEEQETTVLEIDTIKAGDDFENQICRFECLHPPENCTIEDSNAYSQCFYVEFEQGFSLLLTGDVEDEGEELLLAELQDREIHDITLLKVAHHGSRNSTGEEFLKQIQPDLAVISCGKNNSYGHPHEETLDRLAAVGSRVLTTPECGAITVEIGQKVEVYCYKNSIFPTKEGK